MAVKVVACPGPQLIKFRTIALGFAVLPSDCWNSGNGTTQSWVQDIGRTGIMKAGRGRKATISFVSD